MTNSKRGNHGPQPAVPTVLADDSPRTDRLVAAAGCFGVDRPGAGPLRSSNGETIAARLQEGLAVRAARWRGTDIHAAADVRGVREEAREHARVAAVEHLYQRCPALRAGDDVGLVVAVDICSRDGYAVC